jgi:hypothetical protein
MPERSPWPAIIAPNFSLTKVVVEGPANMPEYC